MEMEKFWRELFEAGRWKGDSNLMDRKIVFEINGDYAEIDDICIDYKGDVRISISVDEDN